MGIRWEEAGLCHLDIDRFWFDSVAKENQE